MCRSKPVGIIRAKGSCLCFKTRTTKQKRHLSKNQMSFMMNLYMHVVQCFSIKCEKRHHKYCVSRTKLLTSGDIELNPGPVILREIIQSIVLNCYNLDKYNMA